MSAVSSQVSEEEAPLFPEAVHDDVEGLMYLGYLEDSFSFCGHDFVIYTLKGDDELMAGVVSKDYIDTLGQSRAWAWAIVGLSLAAVDGDEEFCPQAGPNKLNYARARFQYVTSNWYWPVAEHIFTRYSALLERQNAAVKAAEDFAPGNLPSPSPSVGSLTDRDDSPVRAEILDLLDEDEDSPKS